MGSFWKIKIDINVFSGIYAGWLSFLYIKGKKWYHIAYVQIMYGRFFHER